MNIEQIQRMVIGWVSINYSPRTPNSIEETFNAMSNISKANIGSPEGWEYRVQLYGRGDSYFHHVDKNESTKLDPRIWSATTWMVPTSFKEIYQSGPRLHKTRSGL
jgi:hypothetical protein